MVDKPTERAIRLIEYLAALARINSKIIRSVEEYKSVLWMHEIPHEPKHCFCQAWGEEDEHGEDIWIEIKKMKEPKIPSVPEICRDWVDFQTLRNISDIPELRQTIQVENEKLDTDTGEKISVSETVFLANFPEVKKTWDEYLEERWLPWTEIYNRYDKVQKVYADLFHIYQEQQKLGEQYELVSCLGFLSWRSRSGHNVRRHLITARASLEFEPHLGKFTVKPPSDDGQVNIEFDMLDPEEHPQNERQLVEDGHRSIGSIWDKAAVDVLLSSIANSLSDSGQGEYEADHLKPKDGPAPDKPIVEYAPALVLRPRSMRNLEDLLAQIKKQIEGGGNIPETFIDLYESLGEAGRGGADRVESTNAAGNTEVYFPLLANEEQRRIVRTLESQKGVLVQGPPGTGKSHTIANLICHLLATGKRVLVSAKTPRALQVLHDKLPAEIKPLCISLLGNATEERASLEKSVVGIITRLDRRDELNAEQRIQELEGQIQLGREEKAMVDNNLLALREAETYRHTVADGAYSGTATQIARKLREDEAAYSWFLDKLPSDAQLPLTAGDIECMCRDLVELDLATEKQLSRFIPDPHFDLPASNALRELFREEKSAKENVKKNAELHQSPDGRKLLQCDRDKVEVVCSCLSDLVVAAGSVRNRPMAWIPEAVHDVLTGKDTPWKELLKLSINRMEGLRNLVTMIDDYQVHIPAGVDRKKLLHDAKAIKSHLDAGGGMGYWIFRPKAVREHGELPGRVKVDGLDCNKPEILKKLIDYLHVAQTLERVWELWSGKAKRHTGPFPIQVAEIEELHEALGTVIQLCDIREKAKKCVENINGLRTPRWEDSTSLHELMEICRAVQAQLTLQEVNQELEKIHDQLSAFGVRQDAHPIVSKILNSFRERDIDKYCRLSEELAILHKQTVAVIKKHEMIRKLSKYAPRLAGELTCCSDSFLWGQRLRDLEKAWAWARGMTWLTDLFTNDQESLERHSQRLDEDIRQNMAELAALKAWNFCFRRMGEDQDHRRHLMGWQLEMRKYGKGTGKHAPIHRRNAQRHLNKCRTAVPAWIMPLHRVYETVEAGAGIFDVIIVDEASQCGPEALPLLYLGKRILVVGDDKQISPEAVGVDRSQIHRLMQDYLYDFEHADSFDVENSLFAHGQIRFGNRIPLREHFRCMPEIIHFSNDLCYSTDPLIPLRQYPRDRLEPLKPVHVPSGYREGFRQKVINRPEAGALVEAVVSCCNDERYQGMTMGVIVLQGDAQAYVIQDMLLKRLGAEEMEERRLICGNPYSFQGDERDVIFLSLVAAPNERIGPLTQSADQRRFNVAASRAKDQMWLFHSVTSNHLSGQCYRRRLLEYFNNPKSQISQALGENAEDLREKAHRANRMIEKPPQPFESWFEVDVALDIAGRGYRVVPQFKFADKRIDLVVQGQKAQLALECDGDFWHGKDEFVADMERQRKLERCGWQFFRIRGSCYYATPEKALEPLWVQLERMGIRSVAEESTIGVSEHEQGVDQEDNDNGEEQTISEEFLEEEDLEPDDVPEEEVERVGEYQETHPKSIYEALRVKSHIFGRIVIETLRERPNNSCMRESMPTYILKKWNVKTRGFPRKQFAKKVDDYLAVMARKGYITIYKSKNIRIKLGWVPYPGSE